MTDLQHIHDRDHRDDAVVPSAPTSHAPADEPDDGFLDELAAGAHDDALVRLVTGHLLADAESRLWADARFVAWWAEEQQAIAARIPDDEYFAAGHALRANVHARRLGVVRYATPPQLRRAPVVGSPGQVIDEAAHARSTPVVDLGVAAGVGRELWDEAVETWLDLPDDVPPSRYLAIRIDGDSMEPAMRSGDLVLVALGVRPRAGAAIVARHPDDGYVCKRVRRLRATTIELESLAPDRPVIVLPRRDELVLGAVVAVWSGGAASSGMSR